MAASALEAKINKIRQQNEKIKRRYEEVEEDKKNAAKLNALVQMVPSTDWPERKEPPEFFNPPRTKQKSTKEKHEYVPQPHPGEGKKGYAFVQGEGPPPDPKYNFLADSEREECNTDYTRENMGNKSHNRVTRGNFRKKIAGREGTQKDNKIYKVNHKDEYQPGYEAWRAERNRIDEDRISRQRTAEGNWRREWDNDKMHIVDDVMKTSVKPTLGDFAKKDHKDFDRRYHSNGNDHVNHNRGNHRPHRGQLKSFHGNYDNRSHNTYDQHRHSAPMPAKAPLSPTSEERTVIATDKSIKVTLNQGNVAKGPVMSVKVNTQSIAGTGRVGPRQRTRITYSHSDAEGATPEIESFSRQKSFDDKSKGTHFNNQKSPNIKRSHSQKKKEIGSKSPYLPRKDTKRDESDVESQMHGDNQVKTYPQRSHVASKSPRSARKNIKLTNDDPNMANMEDEQNVEKSDANVEDETVEDFYTKMHEVDDTEVNDYKVAFPEVETFYTENDKIITPEETELSIETHESNIPGEEKPDEEARDIAPISSSDAGNTEHITKDTNKDNAENESECSMERVNNLTEDPQEKLNLSSNELVSGEVESQEELAPIESNNLDSIVKMDDAIASGKDDERLSEEICELSANDNCDNIKDEAADEDSSKAEKCSVIEVTDQSVCIDEKEEAVTLNDKVAETINEEAAQAVKEEVAENVKNETAEVIEEEVAEAKREEVAENVKNETAEVIKEEVAEAKQEEVPENVKNETAEVIKEEVAEAIKEYAPEEAAKEVAEPVNEETVNTEERTDKIEDVKEGGNNDTKDIAICSEVKKSENTVNVSIVNVDGNLEDKVEAPKESIEKKEIKEIIEDLKN